MMGTKLLAVDLEGNGARPPEMVELCVLGMANHTLTGFRRHWLLKPTKPISEIVSRIHGITDDDVRNAPSIEDIAGDLAEVLEAHPVVGHNVRVDLDVLARALPEWAPARAIDTLKLARLLRPGLESYGLQRLGDRFGLLDDAARISGGQPHSAPYDAALCALLLGELLRGLDDEAAEAALTGADILAEATGTLL